MRFRQDPKTLELVPVDEAAYMAVHHVMPDISPYRSMVDGSIIDSRRKHHEHLARHGKRVVEADEIRAPKSIPDVDPQGRKETIARQIMGMGHKNFKQALNREIEHIKWNSRER
jgi:hypothetical protein